MAKTVRRDGETCLSEIGEESCVSDSSLVEKLGLNPNKDSKIGKNKGRKGELHPSMWSCG
jgi:hypothetical protein